MKCAFALAVLLSVSATAESEDISIMQCQERISTQTDDCEFLSSETECRARPICLWQNDQFGSFCFERPCRGRTQSICNEMCFWNGTSCIEPPVTEPPTLTTATTTMNNIIFDPCLDANQTECQANGNCTWHSGTFGGTNQTFEYCALFSCDDVPNENVCRATPECRWAADMSMCVRELIIGSGSIPGSGMGTGVPEGCESIHSESECNQSSTCIWRNSIGSGLGSIIGIDSGFCDNLECSDITNQSQCTSFESSSEVSVFNCFWNVSSCEQHMVSFLPDQSPCFRIRDATRCMQTSGCIYDNVSTAIAHCRGPCTTQDSSSCSIGCVATGYQCMNETEAPCDVFGESNCPSNRCEFRETPFACPFQYCTRGSPCAPMSPCTDEGFNSSACCPSITTYCNRIADPACYDSQVQREILERFNCTFIVEVEPTFPTNVYTEPPIATLPEDVCLTSNAMANETLCRTLPNCTWRSFIFEEGTATGDEGYCDAIQCWDFNTSNTCNAQHGCTWDLESNCTVELIIPTQPNFYHSGSATAGPDCVIQVNETSCISAGCLWVQNAPPAGSSSGNFPYFCLDDTCYAMTNRTACESHAGGCVWQDDYCDEYVGSGSVTPRSSGTANTVPPAPAGCFEKNQSACSADPSCIWDEVCFEFQCESVREENICVQRGCTWTNFSTGSGSSLEPVSSGVPAGTCEPSIDDVTFPCLATNASGCESDPQCIWISNFCWEATCEIMDSQSGCESLSNDCTWHYNIYDGAACYNTSQSGVLPTDTISLTAYTIACPRISDRGICDSINFCRWVDGGPGCREVCAECELCSQPQCNEYDDSVACVSNNCAFDFTLSTCSEITTTAPETLPPYARVCENGNFRASSTFFPNIWFGRFGQFSCSEVYSVEPSTHQSTIDQPTATSSSAPTASPPPPTTASPTVAPVGHSLRLRFPNTDLSTLSELERSQFEFGVEYNIARRLGLTRQSIVRTQLEANPMGGLFATVYFTPDVTDGQITAVTANLVTSPLTVTLGGTTYRSADPEVTIITRSPTPPPSATLPTYPSGTLAPTPPPSGTTSAAESEDGLSDNTTIIIIVVIIVVLAFVAFVVWMLQKRASNRAPAPVRPTHENPVYQKAPPPANGAGGSAGGGMVRVESMC